MEFHRRICFPGPVVRRFLSLTAALLAVAAARGDVVDGTYVGSSQTAVQYLNPNTFQVISTATYRRKLKIAIAPPRTIPGAIENNPFSFAISPFRRSAESVPGEVFAASARVFNVNGTNVLLQYWDVDSTERGFVASLFNNHAADGVARDRVIALSNGTPKRFLMHDPSIGPALQCKMTGRARGRELNVTITGYAFVPGEALIKFTTQILSRRP